MDDIVGPIKAYLAKRDPSRIENFVFRLHSRLAFGVLLSCMCLVASGQYFGNPIDCISDGVPGGTLNLFCWIHSTFTLKSKGGVSSDVYGVGNPHSVGLYQPHPGVQAPHDEELNHHRYYQWVIFFFFLQAVMFYLPRLIWKHAEGGLIRNLVDDLTDPLMTYKQEERVAKVMDIKRYFKEDLRTHGGYAINFFLCELLTLVNVVGQIYFTDMFLGYQFTTYGLEVISMTTADPGTRADPMNVVFPKVTKCTFHMYGPSGTITKHDSMCILALNIINEKIFVFLWFFFVILAIITAISMLYRILVISSLEVRVRVIKKSLHDRVHDNMIRDVLTCPNHSWIDQIGDYWVFFLLSKNLPAIAMKELLEELKPIMNPTPQFGYATLEKENTMPM